MLEQIDFPDHVRAALREGKLWRAKEILRGRIGSLPYAPALYEQYGAVLLAMQDTLQAGKYLFLSGRSEPAYAEAIALYLARHGRKGGRELISSFPGRVRTLPLSALPPVVREELLRRGLPPAVEEPLQRVAVPVRTKVLGFLGCLGLLAAALFVVASFFAGAPLVVRAVGDLLR